MKQQSVIPADVRAHFNNHEIESHGFGGGGPLRIFKFTGTQIAAPPYDENRYEVSVYVTDSGRFIVDDSDGSGQVRIYDSLQELRAGEETFFVCDSDLIEALPHVLEAHESMGQPIVIEV